MVIITIVTITVMINVTAWVLVWSWVGQKHDVEIQSSSKSLTWSTVAVLESHPGLKSFAISIVNIIIFIDTTDLINSHYACVLAFFIMVSITIKSNHQNHCPRHARVSARNQLHDHLDHHHHTTDLINSHYARILARRAAAVGRRQRWRALLQVPGKGEKPPQRKRKAIEIWTFYLCLLTMVYSPLELLKIWKVCRWSLCTWDIGRSWSKSTSQYLS